MSSTIEDAAGALVSLRAVLATIDAGELSAERDQVAFLRGAVVALEQVTDTSLAGVSQAGH